MQLMPKLKNNQADPKFEEILKQLSHLNTNQSPALKDYLLLANANHHQPIAVTKKEVAKDAFPVGFSYGVGFIAAIVYIGVAVNAAQGNKLNEVLNPTGAVILNGIVNGFFANLVISPIFDQVFSNKSAAVRQAILYLQNKDPSWLGIFISILQALGVFTITIGPAFLSALPFYILDTKESKDSEFTAIIILISATLLQYNGVKAMLTEAIPNYMINPLKSIFRRCNEQAIKRHQIQTTIANLKSTHIDALDNAKTYILGMLQQKQHNNAELKDIFTRLTQKNPSKQDSTKLLFALLHLARQQEHQGSPLIKGVIQFLSLVAALTSLPGYFLLTKESTDEYAQLESAFLEWLLASAIFLVSVALSLDVGKAVGGDLYDIANYAFYGIRESWRNSNGIIDFAKKAWRNKFDMASWQTIFRLPLSVQQNPRAMLSLITLLYLLSYWSTQTSTYLNEEQLGEKAASWLNPPTVIAVMLFNAFPVDKVLGSAQRFLTRWLGGDEAREEIQVEQFLQNQSNTAKEVDDGKFLEILNNLVTNPFFNFKEKEQLLKVFLGNKNPADVFGADHKYAAEPFQAIIPKLMKKKLEQLDNVGFFKKNHLRNYGALNDYAPDSNLLAGSVVEYN